MTVIGIINQSYKIYKIVRNMGARMKPYGPYEQITSRFPPNYRSYVRDVLHGSDIAFSGGLIVNALEYFNDALQTEKQTPSNKNGQTRNNMDVSSAKRFSGSKRSFISRRGYCKRRYRN